MSNHTNLFKTKLVGSYSNSDTIIAVEDASGLTTFPTKVVIFNPIHGDPSDAFGAGEAEIVNVTDIESNEFLIERGQENTSAVALSDGWIVYQTITANTIDDKVESWGNVQGTLSDQTDLQTALDGKADIEVGSYTASLEGSVSGVRTFSQLYIKVDDTYIINFNTIQDLTSFEGDISITLPDVSAIRARSAPLLHGDGVNYTGNGLYIDVSPNSGVGQIRHQSGGTGSTSLTGADISSNSAWVATLIFNS